jgi:hypothetical protein
VAGYKVKLADIEARVQAIAPDFRFPPQRHMPNPHFQRGELPRLVLDIMREARGPITVRVIAVEALTRKGCPLPGPGTRRRTHTRVFHTLAGWQARGLVVSVGSGKAARRVLVSTRGPHGVSDSVAFVRAALRLQPRCQPPGTPGETAASSAKSLQSSSERRAVRGLPGVPWDGISTPIGAPNH